VFEELRDVLYVTRPEGDWCLLCGEEHPDDSEAFRVVAIHHLLERDPSLGATMDLGMNEEAERAELGSPWIRSCF
jgi:hypothetical protein